MSSLRQPIKWAGTAEVGVAEGLGFEPEPVGERHQQPVVGLLLVLQAPAHLEIEAIADEDKWNVVQRVGVALTEFVRPDDEGVVEKCPLTTRFWCLLQSLG